MTDGQGWKVDSEHSLIQLMKHLQEVVKQGGSVNLSLKPKDKRTAAQNNALHLYFKLLADDLNESGFDQLTFPWKEGAKLDWTAESVKEHLWKPIQNAMLKESQTSKMKKEDVDQVYQTLARALAEKTGVTTSFPSQYLQELSGDTADSRKD